MPHLATFWGVLLTLTPLTICYISRQEIVEPFNPQRNGSSHTTPIQVGNGNFAFGADITGMQTIQPFNILSTWGWHNSSLPTTPGQLSPEDFTGVQWWTHGRLVGYAQGNLAEPEISNWLRGNPHRLNLGRIGLLYNKQSVRPSDLSEESQILNVYTGTLTSNFSIRGTPISLQTVVDPDFDTVGFRIESKLLLSGMLGVELDFPSATDSLKFEAPYVGVWNESLMHETTLRRTSSQGARILHTLKSTRYDVDVRWTGNGKISGPTPGTHRYVIEWHNQSAISLTVSFEKSFPSSRFNGTFSTAQSSSRKWWMRYWQTGAFVDCSKSSDPRATELQRRIILSQYLLAVNCAGSDPPQESGLVNNGWYGKFHMEMAFWHLAHWARWNRWSLFNRALPSIYLRFLPTSIERAAKQGYKGARWGKMSDPSGRSAPGAVNSLLIWQQPHPLYFAELEYRSFPTNATLAKWDSIVTATADFMASYAYWNLSTSFYDLGPPLYPVSENTNPNQTVNPTFELTYWKLGLDIAVKWKMRQGQPNPPSWSLIASKLKPLPVQDGVYVLYEGVRNMWNTPKLTADHPALLGIYGWLPPLPSFNYTIFQKTVSKVYENWDLAKSYGWDFPLLAMTAARMNDSSSAIDLLLHSNFQFDDVGMPIGGARAHTPYFPSSGGLLLAVAMLAGGWDGSKGPHFPTDWQCNVEDFVSAM